MVRGALVVVLLACSAVTWAETLITKAKIVQVTERGFVLSVGTEAVPVQDESATRFWKERRPARREAFAVGDVVTARLRVDATPTLVRELSDMPTWEWLTRVRGEALACTVVRCDLKTLVARLEDGSEFTYRFSDKSAFRVKGATVSAADLKEGQRLYIKGRLLPTLDTWIVTASDERPAPTPAKGKKQPAPKPLKLASSGTLKGDVDLHQPAIRMIDLLVSGRLLHVMYVDGTTFRLDGKKSGPSAIQRGLRAEVLYRRDQFGRLIASKVELFHSR